MAIDCNRLPPPSFKQDAEYQLVVPQYQIDDYIVDLESKEFPTVPFVSVVSKPLPLSERFLAEAEKWERNTVHISSASDLVNDESYRNIIGFGWDVVPYLLNDLQTKKRFWFPALHSITGIRPFDKGDSSNYRRMTEAWLKWGKRKGLI